MCNDTEFFNLNACFRARFVTNSNEADSADANAKIGLRFEYWTIPCPCENDAECTGDVDRCPILNPYINLTRFAKKIIL